MQTTSMSHYLTENRLEQQYFDKKYLLGCLQRGAGNVPGLKWSDAFWGFKVEFLGLSLSVSKPLNDHVYQWLREHIEANQMEVEFYPGRNGDLCFVVNHQYP